MSLRTKFGGMAEAAINKAIDDFQAEGLKKKVMEEFEKLVDKLSLGAMDDLKMKIKANYVDLIDGEDDIPNV